MRYELKKHQDQPNHIYSLETPLLKIICFSVNFLIDTIINRVEFSDNVLNVQRAFEPI